MDEHISDVSVVIPYGKSDGRILRCVSSVLAQTIPVAKVIVVANNGITTDQARLELSSLHCSEIVVVVDGAFCRTANEARNTGCALSSTVWTALVDSDDWWDPEHVRACFAAIGRAAFDVDLVYGSLFIHSAQGQEILMATHFSESLTPENYLLAYYPAQTSSYFFRTNLVRDNPWCAALRRHQDFEWFARVARVSRVVVNTQATVHVEWLEERTHKAHADCWSVIQPWRPNVRRILFRRHHRNLLKSAIKSRDKYVFRLGLLYLLDFFRRERDFLNGSI